MRLDAGFAGALAVAGGIFFSASTAMAETVAWWRFEDGVAGNQVTHGAADGLYAPDLADSSGKGNELSAWTSAGWGGEVYRANTLPSVVIPQTGAANTLCLKNSGSYPGLFTETGSTLQTMTPAAWTIEVSFKCEMDGWRTFVGRDSQGSCLTDAQVSALYLQMTPEEAVAIKFCDVSGVWHQAQSANDLITGFYFGSDPEGTLGHWYNMAAVSDGTLLSLYLMDVGDGETGYSLVAQTDMTGSSANTALSAGAGDGGDWDPGNFSVARGLYGGGHGDRAYGFLDEVRISNSALATNEFLFAIPEPSTVTLGAMAALTLLFRRRKAR